MLVSLSFCVPWWICLPAAVVNGKVVPILIPVSENASDIAENDGIGISECTSLCTDLIPCDLLATIWHPAAFLFT